MFGELAFSRNQERHFVFDQRRIIWIRLNISSQREALPFIKCNRTLIRARHHQSQFVYSTSARPGLNCSDQKSPGAAPAACRRYPHGDQMRSGRIMFIQKSCGNAARSSVVHGQISNPRFAVHFRGARLPICVRKYCFPGVSTSKGAGRILECPQARRLECQNIVRVDLFKNRHAVGDSNVLTDYNQRRRVGNHLRKSARLPTLEIARNQAIFAQAAGGKREHAWILPAPRAWCAAPPSQSRR